MNICKYDSQNQALESPYEQKDLQILQSNVSTPNCQAKIQIIFI